MNFKIATAVIALLASSLIAPAQAPRRSAHQAAHQQQLAHQNRMDPTAINKMVAADVEARERIGNLSAESSRMIDDMLVEAKRYIGTPYVLGGKGPKVFDCSGFTSFIYKQFGFNISPGSRNQFTQGTPVNRNDLRKGDLVFFTSRSSGKNVGHVGIVWSVEPNGAFKFIHASVTGVKISDFAGYYVSRYVGAKRIITK